MLALYYFHYDYDLLQVDIDNTEGPHEEVSCHLCKPDCSDSVCFRPRIQFYENENYIIEIDCKPTYENIYVSVYAH